MAGFLPPKQSGSGGGFLPPKTATSQGGNPLFDFMDAIGQAGASAAGTVAKGAGNVANFAGQAGSYLDPIANAGRLAKTVTGSEGVFQGYKSPLETIGGTIQSGANSLSNLAEDASVKMSEGKQNAGAQWAGGALGNLANTAAGATIGGGAAKSLLSKLLGGKALTVAGSAGSKAMPIANFLADSLGSTQGITAVNEGRLSSPGDLLMGLGIDSSLSALGKLGKVLSKETLQKSTSLPMNVFETAYKQGDDLSRVQNIGADEASNQLFGKLKGKLDDSITNLSETGKGYAEIRKSGEKLALPTTWFDDALDSVGLKPTKQGIKATADSAIRDAADLNQLDEVYRRYANIKNPTANQVLNLRSDLSNLVEKSLNKTDMKVFTTKLRGFVDESAKKGLTGLTNLDEAYSSQKQFFDKIKTDFFSKNKDLKDNTATLIQRLGNPSNVKKLDRLEELLPGLKEEVKLIKATQAIEGAQGNQVGNYVRSALTGGSAITGNVPGALLAVASNPKVATGIAKQLGKAAPVINKVAKYTPPIISSLAKYLALPRSKQQ